MKRLSHRPSWPGGAAAPARKSREAPQRRSWGGGSIVADWIGLTANSDISNMDAEPPPRRFAPTLLARRGDIAPLFGQSSMLSPSERMAVGTPQLELTRF